MRVSAAKKSLHCSFLSIHFGFSSGLNVHSMLKHETLVLTTAALEHLEGKLLYALHCTDSKRKTAKFNVGL